MPRLWTYLNFIQSTLIFKYFIFGIAFAAGLEAEFDKMPQHGSLSAANKRENIADAFNSALIIFKLVKDY